LKTNAPLGCLLCQVLASYLPMPQAASAEDVLAKLKAADAQWASAQSVKAKFTRIDAYPGPYQDVRQTGIVTVTRPGQVRIEISRARRVTAADAWKDSGNNTLTVTDGKDSYYVFFHPHSAQVRRSEPATKPSIDEVPLLSEFFGGNTSASAVLAKAIQEGSVSNVSVSGNELRYQIRTNEYTVTLAADGTIREYAIKNTRRGSVQTWTLDQAVVNPKIDASAFRYSPPKDALAFDDAEKSALLEIGSAAPDITVLTRDGKNLNLSELRGKVVVLEFFATWCWPCNQSVPHVNQVVAQQGTDKVVALAVAIKGSKKDFDVWTAKHRDYRNIQFTYEIPEAKLSSHTYRVSATPTTYVIDAGGRISAAFTGYAGPTPELAQAIQAATLAAR
jgi:peroxiredoxin/outer membrane lipoprotein-sorting protein